MGTRKVGVIGAGAIAPSHCKGVMSHKQGAVAAIADSNEERCKAVQAEFGIPKRYASIDEMIADREIDAVSIALPTFLHADVAVKAMEAGKHVLLDKPFAMNTAEAVKVVETARKTGKIFTVGMNQRFAKDSQIIRTLSERGTFGEIYHAKAYWLRRSGIPRFGTWFGDKKRSGGGGLLDIGVHMLDLCLSLIGNFEAESVSGVTYTEFGNRGLGEGGWGKSDREEHFFDVDDFAGALIKLKGGASVILEISWARHQAMRDTHDVELFGTEAGASVYPARLYRYSTAADGEYEVVEPQEVPIKYAACDRLNNWLDAITGNGELECKPEQSLAVQKIIDGIYASAESGRETIIT